MCILETCLDTTLSSPKYTNNQCSPTLCSVNTSKEVAGKDAIFTMVQKAIVRSFFLSNQCSLTLYDPGSPWVVI
jgi:uncharacterized Fe-S radical SAM superfamily protein PflX